MDFQKELMEIGDTEYTSLWIRLLPNVYLAYRTSLSEGTEVFHSNVRDRWRRATLKWFRRWRHGRTTPPTP